MNKFFYYPFLCTPLLLGGCFLDTNKYSSPSTNNTTLEGKQAKPVCLEFYEPNEKKCLAKCGTDQHVASSEEKKRLVEEVNESSLEEEEKEEILRNAVQAKGVCLEGVGLLRPNHEVFVKSRVCICLNGKPDSLNNCSAVCAGKTFAEEDTSFLYGSVHLGPNILNNPKLGNLKNWCEVDLSPDYPGPGCVLEVISEHDRRDLQIEIPTDSNSFTVNVSQLPYETTYIAKIVETNSTSNVESDTFQIYRKKYLEESDMPVGPLKTVSVAQYTCLNRRGSIDNNDDYFVSAVKDYYYYNSNRPPNPVLTPRDEKKNNFFVCHDTKTYRSFDSSRIPRLELIPHHFMVWDESDIRFYDRDENNSADINKYIQDTLLEQYGISSSINIFNVFSWNIHPQIAGLSNLGFVMQPWVDDESNTAFCPTREHYIKSDKPVFKILREIVGGDTEGLFVAQKQAREGEPTATILIREGLLEQIWFYFEDGKMLIPDTRLAQRKEVHFFWPADPNYPLIRKPTSRLYTVKSFGQGDGKGLRSKVNAPDKRIACIPSADEYH